MAKLRLLQAACTAAMLAAVPAYAQSTKPTGDAGGANAPAAQQSMPDTTTPNTTTPNSTMGQTGSQTPTPGHRMHKSAMESHRSMRSARTDTSQDSAVDRLNERSYQAAQQGQPFDASSTSGGTSGSTMPHGTMPSGGTSGGSSTGSGKL
ncbi:hypothetical protein [Rhodopila sp.]|uniref:hypothetical protein n=1 Tax=Rhodopila sp. TaxID=2480087 RepID=UPI003D0C9941